ncbi:hypothetical protein BHM03_00009980 [Ensete ventricosum]|nr:hypothetical protein BHM03_00009980 [Ensete ventricosum]
MYSYVYVKECNFDLYCPVRAIHTGSPGYQYVDRPLSGGTAKIDRQRSIEGEIDRRRSIEGKEERRRRGKEERRRGEERSTSFLRTVLACASLPLASRLRVGARLREKKKEEEEEKKKEEEEKKEVPPYPASSSPTCHRSPAGRPCKETERLSAQGERSRRRLPILPVKGPAKPRAK